MSCKASAATLAAPKILALAATLALISSATIAHAATLTETTDPTAVPIGTTNATVMGNTVIEPPVFPFAGSVGNTVSVPGLERFTDVTFTVDLSAGLAFGFVRVGGIGSDGAGAGSDLVPVTAEGARGPFTFTGTTDLTSVSIVAEGIAERGPLTITGISFTGISGLSEIPLSASFPLFGAPAMSLGAASGLLGDSDMETIKSLVALGIVLLPALAFAQGVAQRPGTVRVIPSGFEDHATAKDFGGWIAWRSNHNGNKTQFVPVCNATANGAVLTIIDGQGNSSTHPIDVKVPNDGGNVGQSPNGFSINYNNGSAQIVCDGNNNWMIVSEYAPGGLPPRVVHANQITTFTNSWLTCSDATSCAPYVNNPDYLCDAAQNPSQCALETFEDTLRPSDANRMVVYDAPRNVDLALPRSTPHTGFRPGWSTIVVNRGQGNVTVHVDFRLSRINGGTAPFIIPQGGSAMITAEGDENYIAVEFGGGHTPVPSGSDDRK